MTPFPRMARLGWGIVFALVLVGCAGTVEAPSPSPVAAGTSGGSFPVTLTDDDGVRVTLRSPPRRIVTFAPSATEIVYALGLGDRLVGVSGPYDDYPAAARSVAEVGGAGEFGVDPNIEKVVALDPDLLLTIAGGEPWKDRLRDLGVPVFTTNATNFDDLLHDIRTIGVLTGSAEAADAVTGRMQAEAEAVQARLAAEAPTTCFFEIYYPPLMTVGPDTFIADLLDRAGCASVSATAKSDYPQWSVDDLVRADPSVYLVSSESGASPSAVRERSGFDAITAVASGAVVPIDSDLVSRPGPRIVEGLVLLAQALHPEAFG